MDTSDVLTMVVSSVDRNKLIHRLSSVSNWYYIDDGTYAIVNAHSRQPCRYLSWSSVVGLEAGSGSGCGTASLLPLPSGGSAIPEAPMGESCTSRSMGWSPLARRFMVKEMDQF